MSTLYHSFLSLCGLFGPPINQCITEVKTIERQARAAQGCLVAGQSPWARVWTAAYRLHARSVCDTTAPLQLQYAACGATQVICVWHYAKHNGLY